MIRRFLLIIAACVGLLPPLAARAQTTTLNPADCNASITLSGGNLVATVSKSLTSVVGCRGTVPKYFGLKYFTVTVNHTDGVTNGIGLATGPTNGGSARISARPVRTYDTLASRPIAWIRAAAYSLS